MGPESKAKREVETFPYNADEKVAAQRTETKTWAQENTICGSMA